MSNFFMVLIGRLVIPIGLPQIFRSRDEEAHVDAITGSFRMLIHALSIVSAEPSYI